MILDQKNLTHSNHLGLGSVERTYHIHPRNSNVEFGIVRKGTACGRKKILDYGFRMGANIAFEH